MGGSPQDAGVRRRSARTDLGGMGIPPSRWVFLVQLVRVAIVSGTAGGTSPCERDAVVFSSFAPSPAGETTGLVGLVDTFPLIVIENGTVRRPYPWLSLGDTAVEVNFTRHQETVVRELRKAAATSSSVAVTYYCFLEKNFSCDIICKIDDDYLEVVDGKIDGRTIQGEELERACQMRYGIGLLESAWTRIRERWRNVCSHLETTGTTEVKISFLYHADRREAWCTASVSQPVRCKFTIYNDTRVVGGYPCSQTGLTVGGTLAYNLEGAEETKGLKCSVSGKLLREVFADLEMSDSIGELEAGDFSDGAPAGYGAVDGSHGTSVGLSVGIVCVFLIAVAVFVLAFRKKLGPWSLNRVGSRFVYRRTETNE